MKISESAIVVTSNSPTRYRQWRGMVGPSIFAAAHAGPVAWRNPAGSAASAAPAANTLRREGLKSEMVIEIAPSTCFCMGRNLANSNEAGLNERAVNAPTECRPIWHLDRGRALFVGSLGYNAPHAHSVAVFLAGLEGPFRIMIGDEPWTSCRAAVIPAGVPYAFDVESAPLAVLYLEPDAGSANDLVPLVSQTREAGGAVLGGGGALSPLRDIYTAQHDSDETGDALDDLLAFGARRSRRSIDARVSRAVRLLASELDESHSAAAVAQSVGLSSSRFQHLFAGEVGAPFRRYRSWQRLRRAISGIVSGMTFAEAAHAAGFADQAHFARTFRQTFGAPPSPSLQRVRKSHAPAR